VLAFAPRIPQKLLERIVRLDDPSLPIAEVARRVGRDAERLGYYRPSYQRVRELVHQARRLKRRRPSTGTVLWEISQLQRPPDAILDLFTGDVEHLRPP
jgi:hypothetical protein